MYLPATPMPVSGAATKEAAKPTYTRRLFAEINRVQATSASPAAWPSSLALSTAAYPVSLAAPTIWGAASPQARPSARTGALYTLTLSAFPNWERRSGWIREDEVEGGGQHGEARAPCRSPL